MKPKIIIVDENDKVIGYKERDTLKKGDVYQVYLGTRHLSEFK